MTDDNNLRIPREPQRWWKNSAYAEGLAQIEDMKTHVYLSGPMKGYPQSNYPLFNAVASQLRAAGFTVYNPAEFEHDGDTFPIRKAFAEYSRFICEEADMIVLLPGWEHSKGAGAELALAENCGLRVVRFEELNLGIDVAS